ncbi:MAG: T9SS type B sorting domain-containing protein [Winogradskyella sp.]|nr:MAG: T9SS type B sorting domain-containing protein [Winogradskyella sp.]
MTYTIVPVSADNCEGDGFDVNVTISPEPILSTTLDATVCSDDVSGVVLDVEPGSIAAATFNITAINTNGLTASAGLPVVGNGFGANEISDDAYTNTTNAPVIVTYTIVPVSADNCDGNPFDVNVTVDPEPTPNYTNQVTGSPHEIRVCDDDQTQLLVELFDLTQLEGDIIPLGSGYNVVYFRTLQDAIDRVNGIPDPMNYPNIDPVETIYVRVENSFDCFTIVEIEIEVFPLPDASVAVTDWLVCENDTDFLFDFELNSKIPEILGPNQSEIDFEVTFYSTQVAADTEDPTFLLDGTSHQNVGNPQPIFVVISNRITGCTISQQTFNIEVQDGADAFDVVYEECDVVNDNDGSTQFDLESQIPFILGPAQSLTDFSVDFYADFDDAFEGNTNILPLVYENVDIPTQVVYARVSNVLSPEECFDIAEVTLQTNLLPIFDLDESYTLCLASNSEAVVPIPPVIDTGLSDADYAFEWRFNGDVMPTETSSSLIPTQGGTYSVLVTDISTSTVTMCTNFDETEVVEGGIPDMFDVEVTSQTFTGNNMIIATATGNSTYEFSLDDGPWQLSGEFENVTGGDHIIAVRDVLGCGILYENITVIDYPKFFTPNGDGNNDTWTIKGIDSQPSSVIYIHDRYGKLLKQLSPTSPGWDGTYNGNRMPSSDYWFTLEYTEPTNDEKRTFSAHFALKR